MAATDGASPAMSAALLGVLIASGDSAAEAELLRRTEAGDIDAIGEVRSPADLSPRTGKHVIGLAVSHATSISRKPNRTAGDSAAGTGPAC
ncbi:hypothetical protein [Streptomyces rubiginosohelvolus]|uniref:hypothetical protein n=1 Tax=Streptomyces rubiginosohelvolus TaxID=67362 RepID=UPI003680287E